jgi:site-specific DNA-methyltransferase (adenine-specific)
LRQWREKAKIKAYHAHIRNDWETRPETFAQYDREFHFTLDVCAQAHNTKCPRFFSPEDNGLLQDWGHEICWMNPPYDDTTLWMHKAYLSSLQGALVVAYVATRSDTDWFHEWVLGKAEIRFRKRRDRFIPPPDEHGMKAPAKNSAGFPSIAVIYHPPPPR